MGRSLEYYKIPVEGKTDKGESRQPTERSKGKPQRKFKKEIVLTTRIKSRHISGIRPIETPGNSPIAR